eukprot:c1183_g1_i2.p1 GENE.c1183_g1_i2~~c1183_g1_i2.p1  ORF type:complete len:160 (+),score=21.42 c1183_g1_i2:40-519(+)
MSAHPPSHRPEIQYRREPKDWFYDLFKFHESDFKTHEMFAQTRQRFFLEESDGLYHLASTLSPETKYQVGHFSTPSLKELREAASEISVPGTFSVESTCGDIFTFHENPEYQNAVFQAASQFNCLEFVSYRVIPEVNFPFQQPLCDHALLSHRMGSQDM